MVYLTNGILSASIEEKGAELRTLTKDGVNFIWTPVADIWNFTAPIMFPICGALKDGKFIFGGKEYSLPKHGFARTCIFTAAKISESCAIFTLTSSDETLAGYPFDFEFRVIYTLIGESLSVKYEVENKGDGTMYFSIGSHEAYDTPEGIEAYEVVFDEAIDLDKTIIENSLTTDKTKPVLKNSRILPLEVMKNEDDALVLRAVPFKTATLRKKNATRGVRVDFPDMKHMLIWHMKDAPYICIEPWSGMPDHCDADGKIENKLDITALPAKALYTNTHTITPIL